MALRPTKVTRTTVAKDEIDEEVEEIIKPPKRGAKPVLEVEDDDEEEEEEVRPAKSSKKAAPAPVVPARKARPIIEEDDDEEEEEEEEVKPVKKTAPISKSPAPAKITTKIVVPPPPAKTAKKVAAPVEDEDEEEEVKQPVKVKSVQTTVVEGLFEKLLLGMEDGKTMSIKKVGDDKWHVSLTEPVAAPTGKNAKFAGQEYWREITSDEFNKWQEDWKQLTYAEKVQKATKAGVKWEQHSNPKVDVMRLTEAYRTHMGIEKYKPEYQTRAARQALRGG